MQNLLLLLLLLLMLYLLLDLPHLPAPMRLPPLPIYFLLACSCLLSPNSAPVNLSCMR